MFAEMLEESFNVLNTFHGFCYFTCPLEHMAVIQDDDAAADDDDLMESF